MTDFTMVYYSTWAAGALWFGQRPGRLDYKEDNRGAKLAHGF